MRHGVLAMIAALALSACTEDYFGPYGGGGMAYYDEFYGPYYDGYWGPDGFFYFRGSAHDHSFRRDEGHHFHHQPGNGLRGVHGHPGFHGVPHGGGHGGGHGGAHPGGGRPGPGGGHGPGPGGPGPGLSRADWLG